MYILQLTNGYAGSKVHSELFKRLDKMGIRQTVFVPCKYKSWIGGNYIDLPLANIIYKVFNNPLHRYVYPLKIYSLTRSVIKSTDIKKVDLIQAANLFSDGGVALKLYIKYKIPYIVAVRDTDIQYLTIAPFSSSICRNILLNAKKIVFVSKSLEERFKSHKKTQSFISQVQNKFVFHYNGIDDFYLDNINHDRCINHKILFVGRFVEYKNLPRLFVAIDILKKSYPDIQLTIVGGGGAQNDEILTEINKRSNYINFVGKISDKDSLVEIYRQHSIFAMPSIGETFGLVYVEALTQNLSVLYAKNSGIDGLFESNMVSAVDPHDINSIVNGLKKMIDLSPTRDNSIIDFEEFRWDNIVKKYMNLYREVLCES